MRLINVKTLCIEEFVGKNSTPRYAVLSHTWGLAEMSLRQYQEWRQFRCNITARRGLNDSTSYSNDTRLVKASTVSDIDWDALISDNVREGSGLLKILNCARQASSDEDESFEFIWVDTCCIDKSSSAELQEAINSMFRWYEEAGVCYAYLSDVGVAESLTEVPSGFAKSRWFTRGWTLQELLAPFQVRFYNKAWQYIGSRGTLCPEIQAITTIKEVYLQDFREIYRTLEFGSGTVTRSNIIKKASVAQRMSWAAGRETTREEDTAYCLLGLFGIHMPMLYGEGNQAFRRLQEEIMRNSDDASLLAWGYSGQLVHTGINSNGILANSPMQYKNCGSLRPVQPAGLARNEFSMSQGLIRLRASIVKDPIHKNLEYAVLSCSPNFSSNKARTSYKSRNHNIIVLPLVLVQLETSGKGHENETNMYLRSRWLCPLEVPEDFGLDGKIRNILITDDESLFPDLQYQSIKMSVQKYLPDWKLTGVYPPQEDELYFNAFHDRDLEQDRLRDDSLVHARLHCYEMGERRILVYVDVGFASLCFCEIDHDARQSNSWCIIWNLNKPFSLHSAQEMLLSGSMWHLPLCELTDEGGRPIRHESLVKYEEGPGKHELNLDYAATYIDESRRRKPEW